MWFKALICGVFLLGAGCESNGEPRAAGGPPVRTAVPRVSASPPSAPSLQAPPTALVQVDEEPWDDEKAKLAEPWVKRHRAQLWRLAESLPQLRPDIDDRGFGVTMRPDESLGHAFARQRREARGRDYFEHVDCMQLSDGDYDCGLGFGRNGSNPEHDFGLGLSLRVHADGALASLRVVAFLAG